MIPERMPLSHLANQVSHLLAPCLKHDCGISIIVIGMVHHTGQQLNHALCDRTSCST